ncbi:MAG TPA: SIR2 family protein, partial [Gemmatimonadaceae bacterium]|nr:SIR2 family protein [Gemmatimonadaceae bacterium]
SFFGGPRPLPAPIYDGHATDEKFSAKPAGAGWVNGSPAIPMKLGLGSAGGDMLGDWSKDIACRARATLSSRTTMMTGRHLPEPSPALLDALKSNRAVAIVGSGLSCGAGAPSWRDLILGMAADAEVMQWRARRLIARSIEAVERGRFLDAASILRTVLSTDFEDTVVRQLRTKRSLSLDIEAVRRADAAEGTSFFQKQRDDEPMVLFPTESHRYLTQLGFRVIVTTNYDRLIEQAHIDSPPTTYVWSYEHLAERIQSGNRFILKLHGDIDHPRDLIIAREDYSRLMFQSRVHDAVKLLFGTHRLFWVGYGHNDPDLDLVLDDCTTRLGMRGGHGVIFGDDPILEERFRAAQITPSFLPSYDDLPGFLEKIAGGIGVTLKTRFVVLLGCPWPGQAEAERLAKGLATALSVRYVGVERGSIRAYFEASVAARREIRERLLQKDPVLREIAVNYRLAALDGIAIAADGSGQESSVTQPVVTTETTAPPPGTEGIAAQACKQGDYARAARAVIEGYGAEIYSFLVGQLRGEESKAAEVFSDFTEQLWRGLPNFDWRFSMRAWCYRLARSSHRRLLRTTDKLVELSETVVYGARPSALSSTSSHRSAEVTEEFQRLREELSPVDRDLVTLRVDRGLSWRDISFAMAAEEAVDEESVRKTEAALRTRFAAIRKRLRDLAEKGRTAR